MASDAEVKLRERAGEMLAGGKVALVVGYGARPGGGVRPVFVRAAEEAERLVWNAECAPNLAGFLTREPCRAILAGGGRVAVVAKGCDARAIVALVQEKQVKRESVHVIGMVCEGVAGSSESGLAVKCLECEVHKPPLADDLVGDAAAVKAATGDALADERRLEAMSDEERWNYWMGELSKCIKCYACRQACPLCYCRECITEKSRPQWIAKSSTARGNLAYHFIRAMHLAGRCVGCEECRRACPMGIRVDLLARYLTRKAEQAFGYKPGMDPNADPCFVTWSDRDPGDFIR